MWIISFFLFSLFAAAADAWLQSHDVMPTRRHLSCFMMATSSESLSDGDSFSTLPRLYVGPDVRLKDGLQFPLTPDQSHYVTKVMRIGTRRKSSLVRVFDGANGEWLAEIEVKHGDENISSKKKRRRGDDFTVTAHCKRQLRLQPNTDNETPPPFTEPWLFFAPIKKQRMKLMLEKCTELGVGRFVPIATDFTESNSIRDVLRDREKLQVQTVEASEQCERLTVPPLTVTCIDSKSSNEQPWNLEDLLTNWTAQDSSFRHRHLLICRERQAECSVPILQLLDNLRNSQNEIVGNVFLVGPEGGWSPREEDLCDDYTKDFDNVHCVSLGSLVLRAETAAIAATSACMLYNDLHTSDNRITDDS